MTYNINVTSNVDKISKGLLLDSKKYRKILSSSLSDVAFKVREEEKEAMKLQLRGPTGRAKPNRYTLNSMLVEKSTVGGLSSAVFVKPDNHYLFRVVDGGIRSPQKKFIFIPAKELRRDQYGNMTRYMRKKLLGDKNRTYTVNSGPYKLLFQRTSKRKTRLVGVFVPRTKYRFGGYFTFNKTAVKAFDKHFDGIFLKNYRWRIANGY